MGEIWTPGTLRARRDRHGEKPPLLPIGEAGRQRNRMCPVLAATAYSEAFLVSPVAGGAQKTERGREIKTLQPVDARKRIRRRRFSQRNVERERARIFP